jgi:O-antigen ligase
VSTAYADFRFVRTEPGARIVNFVLALTILVSPIAFIEPSPYEGMVAVLAVVAFGFGLPIERRILPYFVLLTVWAVSGFFALLPVFSDGDAVKYYAISVYLMITAIMFACLFAEGTMDRLATLANAYVVAAVVVSLIAIAAYFEGIPGADAFIVNGRATGTFKDPNVFGPFLILPILLLIQRILYRGVRLSYVVGSLILLFALFLSFSRGAWAHFVFSALVMVGLLFVTNRGMRFRRRLMVMVVAAVVGVVVLLAVALSISSVREMFTIRAELLQSYDAGERTGRFDRQLDAVGVAIEEPNGLGPIQFGRRFGQDIHNVYLNAFVGYGWAGGVAYLALVFLTLKRGLGAILRDSPWRPYLIVAYATFAGVAAEGMIIDTDHWRHFFLLLGLVWGLSAATAKCQEPGSLKTNVQSGLDRETVDALEWSRPRSGGGPHRDSPGSRLARAQDYLKAVQARAQ